MVKSPLNFPDGPWKSLLEKALWLMDSIESDGYTLPRWSLGGGTVLMFYYAHRKSKDIDIFVPDPQFLGYVNPRLGGRGEEVTADYQDGTEFVKLFLPEGEIDFVASSTLTEKPFEEHEVLGRKILLETPIEIVAKKLWYRGDRATPRDLLDLALVIEHHYNAILEQPNVFAKNIEAFTDQCDSRRSIMMPVFEAIEKIEFKLSFDECLERANSLKADLLRKSKQRFD
ncbi:MAG: nucleotidyl transferase AbiEii/AbiGii toxin family protein [Gallionellaceae bacterium]|nr:nucleotidyl transferase AbiEii/AbiGii toxin family protein [Gallionellaceae bacterium]